MTKSHSDGPDLTPLQLLERTRTVLAAAKIVESRLPKLSDDLSELIRIGTNLEDELSRPEHGSGPGPKRATEIRQTLDYLSGWLEEIDSTEGETEAEDLGRPSRGVANRRQAVELAEGARARLAHREYDAARELAAQALDLEPHLVDALLVPAEIELARGNDEKAARILFHITETAREQLIERQQQNPFLKDKPFPLAFDFFQDADARAYARALDLLAWVLFRLQRYPDAFRATEELVQIDPKSALFAVELRAVTAHMSGHLEDAARYYETLAERQGDKLTGRLGRALLHKAQGDELAASVELQQLLLEYPTLGDFLVKGGDAKHWARSLDPERHLEVQGLDVFHALWKSEKAWIQSVMRNPRARDDYARLEELAEQYRKARTDTFKREISREFERLRNPIRLKTRELNARQSEGE